MKGLPQTTIEAVEGLAMILLASAVKKHGSDRIPVNDPDYCEAFGVLRGATCVQTSGGKSPVRIRPGHGEPTHDSVYAWCRELISRIPPQ